MCGCVNFVFGIFSLVMQRRGMERRDLFVCSNDETEIEGESGKRVCLICR